MKIGSQITLLVALPVAGLLAASLTTLVLQNRALSARVDRNVDLQMRGEAAKAATAAALLCSSYDARNQRDLTRALDVAREMIASAGGLHPSDERAEWQVADPITRTRATLSLPKILLGSRWLGQNRAPDAPVAIVDDIRHFTGCYCTVFQRMNDAGDMLRVATSVIAADGQRALGTFIPARDAAGQPNLAVQTVLRGETYRGRAFVVDQWHATAYEPIWDDAHTRVIGMLYVGTSMKAATQELQAALSRMIVGKTGYVFVLGGTGDQRGRYLVSPGGKRDGDNIWDARDASGRPFIQSLIGQATAQPPGAVVYETYAWKNDDDTQPRTKIAAAAYFAPWDWVIGASAYEDDFADVRRDMHDSQRRTLVWVVATALSVGVIAVGLGALFARRIGRALTHIAGALHRGADQVSSAASQVSASSQTLATSSSEQAASLEETAASLEEIGSMTQRNAEHADHARALTDAARQTTAAGAQLMNEMTAAMSALDASAGNIAQIVKTIDAIAFQTNLLALNAAVEAARAGEVGAGFAVVADEVRRLAQRSAAAARETSEKIDDSIRKSAQGTALSARVAASLHEITQQAVEISQSVAEIAQASREQTAGVTQIVRALGQVDRVTQNNAASAEESAAAAEELNTQAAALLENMRRLDALIGGNAAAPSASVVAAPPPATESESAPPARAASVAVATR